MLKIRGYNFVEFQRKVIFARVNFLWTNDYQHTATKPGQPHRPPALLHPQAIVTQQVTPLKTTVKYNKT